MKNNEIAEMLREIADFLEIEDVQYKPRAYRTAARNIESLSEDIESIHERGELDEIEGVGDSIAEKIAEYLETGELQYYQDLKADLPIDIDAITSVEGVGPKTAKDLYQALGIQTLDDLEDAAEAGEIADVDGFGEQSQQNILEHIPRARKSQERMLLGKAFPIAENVRSRLTDDDAFDDVTIVGSFRRRRPTIGDIDILATATDPEPAMEAFCTHDDVDEVLSRGDTQSSVVVSGDLQMDLRLVDDDEYGAALVYFTGSKDHNITLRNRAIERDWKLNEYGLYDVSDVDDDSQRAGDRLAGDTESDIYDGLDLTWIPPELREDTGEVDAAANDELPALLEADAIRGDLQMHTEYSDGSHTVQEMADAAADRGLEYILITDHGPNAPIPQKLDDSAFTEQRDAIAAVNDEMDLTVFHGIEAELTEDGIDLPDAWFEALDLVVAGLHATPDDPTDRIVTAFDDTPVDIFAHPTNRLLNERDPLDIDFDRVMAAAADNDVAIEINAQPARLDLDWRHVKTYRDTVSYVVSTDAHTTGELDHMHLGVAQARRGWCGPDDILNTRDVDTFTTFFDT